MIKHRLSKYNTQVSGYRKSSGRVDPFNDTKSHDVTAINYFGISIGRRRICNTTTVNVFTWVWNCYHNMSYTTRYTPRTLQVFICAAHTCYHLERFKRNHFLLENNLKKRRTHLLLNFIFYFWSTNFYPNSHHE